MKTIFELLSRVEIKEGKGIKKTIMKNKSGDFSTILEKIKKELGDRMKSSDELKPQTVQNSKVEISGSNVERMRKEDFQEDIQKALEKLEKLFKTDEKSVSKDETNEDLKKSLFHKKENTNDVDKSDVDGKKKMEYKDKTVQNRSIDGDKKYSEKLPKKEMISDVKSDSKNEIDGLTRVENKDDRIVESKKPHESASKIGEERRPLLKERSPIPEERVEKRDDTKERTKMKAGKDLVRIQVTAERKTTRGKNIKKLEHVQPLKAVKSEYVSEEQQERMEDGKIEELVSNKAIRDGEIKDRRDVYRSVIMSDKTALSKKIRNINTARTKSIKRDEKILKAQSQVTKPKVFEDLIEKTETNLKDHPNPKFVFMKDERSPDVFPIHSNENGGKAKSEVSFKNSNHGNTDIEHRDRKNTRKTEFHVTGEPEIREKRSISMSLDSATRKTDENREKISEKMVYVLHQTQTKSSANDRVGENPRKPIFHERISRRKIELVESEKSMKIVTKEDGERTEKFKNDPLDVRKEGLEPTEPIADHEEATDVIDRAVQMTPLDPESSRKITKEVGGRKPADDIRMSVKPKKLSDVLGKSGDVMNVKQPHESERLKVSKDILTIIRKDVERIVFKIERKELNSSDSNLKSVVLLKSENTNSVENISRFKGERFYEKIKPADVKDEKVSEKIASFTEKIPSGEEIKNSNIERMERIVESLSVKARETRGVVQRAEITLRPPHLGKVEISVVEDDGKLKIEFKVATVEAKNEIERNLDSLAVRLNNNGFEIDRITVKLEKESENYQEDRRSDEGWNEQDENQNDQRKRRQNRRNLNWKEGEME